ncbi:MAG: epoxide hydrolase family protein [Myxococcota bacterium]
MNISKFSIQVDGSVLDDLEQRLRATRFPDSVETGWGYGMDAEVLKSFIEDWIVFDFRTVEEELNRLPHFTATVDGTTIHFIHLRGESASPRPALMLLHGWPASFVQMLPILDRLADRFDLIVPSLPGFGFSQRPTAPGMNVGRMGELLHELVTVGLGYARFGLRSSDLGAGVASAICLAHPESVIGSHESGTNPFLPSIPEDLSAEEATFVEQAQQWMQTEMAYAMVHSSKPQTLAASLNDSPAGLAAWMLEKFERWSDGGLAAYDRTELLTNLTLYWVTETIGSSIRLYAETVRAGGPWGRVEVPRGFAMLPADMFPTPRSWIERNSRVDHWTELPRGGHFGEWEVPDLLARYIHAFFDAIPK